MKCYNCRTELIWGGDHDGSVAHDGYDIITNLSCPNCNTTVYVEHIFSSNDEDEPEMWEHYCEEEKTEMAVEKGEPCNWCGKKEEDCESCS